MTSLIKGTLEIDHNRGVIYFHSSDTGHTPLRICSLPKPIPDVSEYAKSIDITHMYGCSWVEKETK